MCVCGHDAEYHESGPCGADFRAFFGDRCTCVEYLADDGTDGKRDRFWGQRDDHDDEGYPL